MFHSMRINESLYLNILITIVNLSGFSFMIYPAFNPFQPKDNQTRRSSLNPDLLTKGIDLHYTESDYLDAVHTLLSVSVHH